MKLLAEWFWTDRWMGSSGFLLPMEARGVYREMLTQAWRRGGCLPNDHEAIQRAIGATGAEWNRSWPRIEKFWRVDGANLVNDTQVEVYAQAHGVAMRASERGRKGAQATAQARAQASAQESPEREPPSPSPSLISVSVSVSERKKELSSADADYERFRAAYPVSRRVGGKAARRAFQDSGLGKHGDTLATALLALEQHKRSEQWQTPKLIPLMTTWLNQQRWVQVLPEPTDSAVAARVTRFMERYAELYPQYRKGARYAVRPARDYAAAVTLCETWADDARLEKLAICFLTTDHKFAAEGSRTIPQFLALSSWADGELATWEQEQARR